MSITSPDVKLPKAKDRIRETARDLFYRLGIRAVGVEEIVTRAGVTKPSLYRSFHSKDDLAVAYLRDYDAYFWTKFNEAVEARPGDPRGQIIEFLTRLGERAQLPAYRGCGLSNAAVGYPEPDHPARKVAEANKAALRAKLRDMAAQMGARDAATLGDGLLLLIEGSYVTSQLFHGNGPALAAAQCADRLIETSIAR
jgi:AcrR family transcriptional regulator